MVIFVATILLIAGFGDGIGFSLATLTGQRSPWIFLLPVLVVPLGVYLIARGPRAIRRREKLLIGAIGVFSVLVFLVEYGLIGDFYVAGLLQLLVFVLVTALVFGVFVSAPEWLDRAFRRSLPIVHYFLSGYVVFSYLSWNFLGWDPSLRVLLTTAGPSVGRYYGFRPSGFNAEPQWAAIALAASYSGIHYLIPRQRLNAFIALLIGAEALQSGTGYVFVGLVVALYVFHHVRASQHHGRVLATAVLLGVGMVLAMLIGGPSLLARAWDEALIAAAFIQSAAAQLVIAIFLLLHGIREFRVGHRTGRELLLTGVLLTAGIIVATFGVAPPSPLAQPSPSASPSAQPTTARPSTALPSAPTTARPSTALPSAQPTTARPSATVARPSPGVVQPPLERATNILTGQDPSTGMRLQSAGVAWRVIERSFPLGVGYGNFRKYAVYPTQFARSIPNFNENDIYKSDFFILNYVAELGILGVVLVICVGGLLINTRHALSVAFFGLIASLSGTVLLPPVLAMAAVIGLLVRDKHERAEQAVHRLKSDS